MTAEIERRERPEPEAALAIGSFLCFSIALGAVIWTKIPGENEKYVMLMLGALIGLVKDTFGRYFGSTKGAQEQRREQAKVAETLAATAAKVAEALPAAPVEPVHAAPAAPAAPPVDPIEPVAFKPPYAEKSDDELWALLRDRGVDASFLTRDEMLDILANPPGPAVA